MATTQNALPANRAATGGRDRPPHLHPAYASRVPEEPKLPRPARSRWTSFVADSVHSRPRILAEEGHPAHRVRVEHNRDTVLVQLSGEDGQGWTVLAVDRATRRWAVGAARRQLDAAQEAFNQLYAGDGGGR